MKLKRKQYFEGRTLGFVDYFLSLSPQSKNVLSQDKLLKLNYGIEEITKS
ncbi:hypothetical protein BC643_3035 [Mangrovibacterium diazotrophicum]|uniref:Uncharacterized protein n=1 Tax=Mangrovibacterium diazotrophicum TaxID=1261403 RepID=A0A419WB43_9BACT|nr:hypothetical protein BC643_3035 [Mangrovibacterium diazotrophicum]